eukprot:2211181-Rhodomonas_salina.1
MDREKEKEGEGGEEDKAARGVEAALRSVSICLRACYAMSGTAIAYDGISLRACYAMSGTSVWYPCLLYAIGTVQY